MSFCFFLFYLLILVHVCVGVLNCKIPPKITAPHELRIVILSLSKDLPWVLTKANNFSKAKF